MNLKVKDTLGAATQRRGIETARAIDRAATELFFTKGYHATSMREIGEASGVQSAAIYHWYSNKEAVLVHLQNEFMRLLTDEVERGVDRHERAAFRLAAAVREHVLFHALHPHEAFVTDSEIRALSPEPRADLIDKRDSYQRYFLEMIQSGIIAGDFSSTDARIATYAILLQCTGVALWFKSTGSSSAEQVAEQHVQLVLGSLHAPATLIASAIDAIRPAPITP